MAVRAPQPIGLETFEERARKGRSLFEVSEQAGTINLLNPSCRHMVLNPHVHKIDYFPEKNFPNPDRTKK